MTYKLLKQGVKRLADGASVPDDVRNTDWQRYLKWVAAGNTPLPADPEPAPVDQADLDNLQNDIKALAMTVAKWHGKTKAELKADFRTERVKFV